MEIHGKHRDINRHVKMSKGKQGKLMNARKPLKTQEDQQTRMQQNLSFALHCFPMFLFVFLWFRWFSILPLVSYWFSLVVISFQWLALVFICIQFVHCFSCAFHALPSCSLLRIALSFFIVF